MRVAGEVCSHNDGDLTDAGISTCGIDGLAAAGAVAGGNRGLGGVDDIALAEHGRLVHGKLDCAGGGVDRHQAVREGGQRQLLAGGHVRVDDDL